MKTMRTKLFLLILFFAGINFAQISFRGGVNYNSITASAFDQLGYEKSPLFSGYFVGLSLPLPVDDFLLHFGFDYAHTTANLEDKSSGSTIELVHWNVPMYLGVQMEFNDAMTLGFQADLVLGGFSSEKQKNGVELSGMYGSMRIGAEAAIILGSMVDVYALASINLGYIKFSRYSVFPVESSDGLATGPELKIGTRVLLIF